MIYALYSILIILNLFICNKKKIAPEILILSFIFLWVFNGWSSGGYDINNSKIRYENASNYVSYTEFLFQSVIVLSNKLGLTYRQFSVIVSALEMLSLYSFIKKYSSFPNLSLALMLIYPLAYVFTLQRFFMALTIVMCFGIPVLLEKKQRYKIKYVLIVIISALFHYSMLFFILFLIADIVSVKKTWFITVIGFILLMSASFFNVITWFFSTYIDREKISNVLTYQRGYGVLGRVILILVISIQFFLIYYLSRENYAFNEENKRFSNTIYKFNIVSFLAIPLTIYFSSAFLRISIAVLMINYVLIFHDKKKFDVRHVSIKTFCSIIVVFVSMIMMLYLVYNSEEFRVLSLYPMFEENELFSFLFE